MSFKKVAVVHGWICIS